MPLSRRSLFKKGGRLGLGAALVTALGKEERKEEPKKETVEALEPDEGFGVRSIDIVRVAAWASGGPFGGMASCALSGPDIEPLHAEGEDAMAWMRRGKG